MKHYVSRTLKTIALLYTAFPIIYIMMAAVLFDIPGEHCVRVLLSPIYYIVGVLAMIAGWGLWEMKRWAWYIFIPANILIIYHNALLVWDYGMSHHKPLAFLASLFMVFAVVYRVSKEVRVPYFFPKIRWWESDPRYRLSVPVMIQRKDGTSTEGEIQDISLGGCFVKLRTELVQDELISLTFSIFGTTVNCDGFVVWRSQSTVTHPKGVGVKFNALERPQKRTLRAITRKLKKTQSFEQLNAS